MGHTPYTHTMQQLLDPQPGYQGIDHFELLPDVWHDNAFKGTPAHGYGNKGEQQNKWYAIDWCGNIVSELQEPQPEWATSIAYVDNNWLWKSF